MTTIEPDFETFAARFDAGEAQVLWTRAPADLDTPVSLMLKLTQAGPESFLLESVTGGESRGRYSIIGWNPDLVWRCQGGKAALNRTASYDREAFAPESADPLTSLRALLAESAIALPDSLPAAAAGLFGYLGYDMIRLVERLPEPNPDPLGAPDALLLRPTVTAVIDNAYDTVTFIAPARPAPGVSAREAYGRAAERLANALGDMERPPASPTQSASSEPRPSYPLDFKTAKSNTPKARFKRMVLKAKEYIAAGDIFQAVLSQRWRTPFPFPAFSLYRALRRTNPSPYMFFFNFGAGVAPFQITGASPEILVRVSQDQGRPGDNGRPLRRVTIRPIAGTRPRGSDAAADAALEAELLADPKERAEHLMLLDLGRNDVGRVAQIGSVDPNAQFSVERYSHVMHIVSNVDGVLRPEEDALSALLAGLPAGTVSGAPKIRAMEIIDELETEKRGVYAGAVGYFSANGDMDTCIALRSAVVKAGTLYLQAGGGVVADSTPDGEFEETRNKAKAVLRAAAEAASFDVSGNR